MRNDKELCEKVEALYRAGYTVKEISEVVGLSEGTVRVIVRA